MSGELTDFVRQALAAKLGREDIAKALTGAGWPEPQVKAALAGFAEGAFPIPVPRPKAYLSARDVFTYLVMFGALYFSVGFVLRLLFGGIDRLFPDKSLAPTYIFEDDSIRWSMAGLIVSYPLFLWMFRIATRRIRAEPAARESRPRKWLTYLTLALAVCALAGDLMSLVYNALGGDLTTPLLLKLAAVAVVAGGSFLYFFSDVRQGEAS